MWIVTECVALRSGVEHPLKCCMVSLVREYDSVPSGIVWGKWVCGCRVVRVHAVGVWETRPYPEPLCGLLGGLVFCTAGVAIPVGVVVLVCVGCLRTT